MTGHFLRKERGFYPFFKNARPLIRFDVAVDKFHQRGFSGPVPSEKGNLLTRMDLHVYTGKERAAAETQGNMLQIQKRHGRLLFCSKGTAEEVFNGRAGVRGEVPRACS